MSGAWSAMGVVHQVLKCAALTLLSHTAVDSRMSCLLLFSKEGTMYVDFIILKIEV